MREDDGGSYTPTSAPTTSAGGRSCCGCWRADSGSSDRCPPRRAPRRSTALFRWCFRAKKRHPRACEDPTYGSDHAWVLACARMTVARIRLRPRQRRPPEDDHAVDAGARTVGRVIAARRAVRRGDPRRCFDGASVQKTSSSRKRGPNFRQRPCLGPRLREDDGDFCRSPLEFRDVIVAEGWVLACARMTAFFAVRHLSSGT